MRQDNRILRNQGNDDGSAGGGGGLGAGNGAGGGGAGEGGTPPQVAARPDALPEEFWDAEKGTVKLDALTPKLAEYQKLAEAQAGAIAKPEDIDWTLPADLDPDNKDAVFEVNKDDPMVQALAPTLVGLPQAKVSELVGAMARFQMQELKAVRASLAAEEKKLGDKYQERIAGAEAFVEKAMVAAGKDAKSAKELASRFRNSWVTAEQVEVIELLAKYAGGPQAGAANNGAGQQPENKGRLFYGGMSGGA